MKESKKRGSMWKHILSLAAIMCMVLCGMPASVKAEGNLSLSYVALGDSISTGYGVSSSFVQQIAENHSYDLTNKATDGATSADVLAAAQTVSGADLITITVGGNDMMNALYAYLAGALGMDEATLKGNLMSGDMPTIMAAAGVISGFPNSPQALAAVAQLNQNLAAIFGVLKQNNPDAMIVITNQYNPYTTLTKQMALIPQLSQNAEKFNTAFETGVQAINSVINLTATAAGVSVADVYSSFAAAVNEGENPCNATMVPNINLDFHPNAAGHAKIAAAVEALTLPDLPTYTLTVENGEGSGEYKAGETVTITANTPDEKNHFAGWTASAGTLTDETASETTFVMPAEPVTVTAAYAAHAAEADDGDCTTAVCCSVCGAVVTPAAAEHSYGEAKANGDGTHTRTCTTAGCEAALTEECQGGTAGYFKKAVCEICGQEYGSVRNDTTAPSGEIVLGTENWTGLITEISYSRFVNRLSSVKITASDDSYSQAGYTEDEAVRVGYYLYSGDKALTAADLESVSFTDYSGTLSATADGNYVIYVKLTDHAGNVTYLSSDGIVLDTVAPVLQGIADGKTYCGKQVVTVSDLNLATVMAGDMQIMLEQGKFTVSPADGVQKIVATDRAGNSTVVSVTVRDSHGNGILKGAVEATCTAEGYTGDKVCEICGEILKKGKTIGKLAHTYQDGKCTVCGAADPDYEPRKLLGVNTGDETDFVFWILLLAAAGTAVSVSVVHGARKRQ